MKLKSIFKKKKDTSNPIPETSNLGIGTPASSPTSPPPITHPTTEQQATYSKGGREDDSINETVVTDAAIKDSRSSTNVNDGYRKSRKASNASSDDNKQSSSSDDNKRERKKGREKGTERSSKTSGDRGDRDRKKGREKGSERKSDRKKGRERGEERKSRKNSKLLVLCICLIVVCCFCGMSCCNGVY